MPRGLSQTQSELSVNEKLTFDVFSSWDAGTQPNSSNLIQTCAEHMYYIYPYVSQAARASH